MCLLYTKNIHDHYKLFNRCAHSAGPKSILEGVEGPKSIHNGSKGGPNARSRGQNRSKMDPRGVQMGSKRCGSMSGVTFDRFWDVFGGLKWLQNHQKSILEGVPFAERLKSTKHCKIHIETTFFWSQDGSKIDQKSIIWLSWKPTIS